MSVASGPNEIETATMQAEASANVEDENIVTVEASEDRLVHRVIIIQEEAAFLSEVSFSSSFQLNQAAQNQGDAISSGVLAFCGRVGSGSGPAQLQVVADYTSGPPQWDAGEEISLHTNNFTASAKQVRVLILYEPIGDFNRERLRNR